MIGLRESLVPSRDNFRFGSSVAQYGKTEMTPPWKADQANKHISTVQLPPLSSPHQEFTPTPS